MIPGRSRTRRIVCGLSAGSLAKKPDSRSTSAAEATIDSATFLFASIALSAALILFAVIALLADDFWIPTGKANSGTGIHLHGTAVWMMGGAIVCACVVILCTVVDHYDKRDNEHVYKKVEMLFTLAGFGAFFSALILHALAIMTW